MNYNTSKTEWMNDQKERTNECKTKKCNKQ